MLNGGMRGIVNGYVKTPRPKFKMFRDKRKKKRAVSRNEKERRIVSMISLGHTNDRINNISSEIPTARRISMGFLKNRLQKR